LLNAAGKNAIDNDVIAIADINSTNRRNGEEKHDKNKA